jgi:hypothetical protein
MSTCYCCHEQATSREHVPPKCIFPRKVPNVQRDYRRNLFTVPSCELHNQAKTHDDEYLRAVLTMCLAANKAATQHFKTTVLRGAREHPSLIRGILSNHQTVYVKQKANTEPFETIATEVDRSRIESSLKQIALGVYFYEFETIYDGNIEVFPFFLADLAEPDSTYNNSMLKIKNTCDQVFRFSPRQGSAPDIFYYQMYFEEGGGGLLNLVFYGGVQICCLLGASS